MFDQEYWRRVKTQYVLLSSNISEHTLANLTELNSQILWLKLWKGSDIISAEPVCEAPATEGGSLQKTGNVAVGEVYTFTCDEGTSMITDGFYGPICLISFISILIIALMFWIKSVLAEFLKNLLLLDL